MTPYQGLLELVRQLVDCPTLEVAARQALAAAIRLVPGAQAGSVLLRRGGRYRFVALEGHRTETLKAEFSLEQQLEWYGDGLAKALQGQPTIGPVNPERNHLLEADRPEFSDQCWALCIPVSLDGQIEMWLSLDRFEQSPFPEETLGVAHELSRSLGVVLRTLGERERSRLRLKREEALSRALALLSTFRNPDLLWQSLPHMTTEILGEEQAAAFRLQGEDLRMVAGVNWQAASGHQWARDLSESWRVLQERQVWVDTEQIPGSTYGAYVPLFGVRGEALGVLNIHTHQPFAPEERSILEVFGRGVGQVLARLEAQVAQKREFDRLQALAFASKALAPAQTVQQVCDYTVEEALNQARATTALILLYQPEDQTLKIVAAAGVKSDRAVGLTQPKDQGLSWAVLREKAPLFVPDAARFPGVKFIEEPQSGAYLGVPLSDSEGGVVGVLSVFTRESDTQIVPDDRYVLEALAKVAGVAISRIGALEQARGQAADYAALVQMSSDLEILSEPLEIARRALETLLGLTGLHAGGLYRIEFEGEGLQREGFVQLQLKVGDVPEAYFSMLERLPVRMGETLAGKALAENTTMVVEDYQESDYPLESRSIGIRTIVMTPITLKGIHYGVLIVGSFKDTVPIGSQEVALFESVARRFERSLERAAHVEELTQTREMALRSLGLGLEIRDLEPRGHTDRVVALATQLGQRLKFPDIEGLRLGAYLHDFGKLAVPETVLQKAGVLDTNEWRMMKTHPEVGFEILSNMPFLSQTARNVVRYHHERWDGSGYPMGLMAEEIPREARLFAVVDVYDTLCQARPYKTAWPLVRVQGELQEQAGKTLDPLMVAELLRYIQETRLGD